MKFSIKMLVAASAMAATALGTPAQQQCQLSLGYAHLPQGQKIPQAVAERLEARITRIMAQEGIASGDPESRFFLSARLDNAYADIMPGPSTKYMVKTELTMYIGDAKDQKKFASAVINLSGVGDTEERAYSKCINGINPNSEAIKNLVADGKQKILDYYNAQYPVILKQAETAMKQRNYDEALYYATSIPECCTGYPQASKLSVAIYRDYTSFQAAKLLADAKTQWGADPTATGARKALDLLAQIDPEAPQATEAAQLGKTIAARVNQQWEFENVQKHRDAVALEKQRIEAAKQVAVAYAKSRPRVVHHWHWLY